MKYFIYEIVNTKSNKKYIGKAKKIKRRWDEHKRNAANGKQHPLYDAIRKHGIEAFEFRVLLETTDQEVDALEKNLIQQRSKYPIGYNLAEGGTGGDTYQYHSDDKKKQRSEFGKLSYLTNPRGISTKSTKGQHITQTIPEIQDKWKKNHSESMQQLSQRRKLGLYTKKELEGYKKQSAQKLGSGNPRSQSIKCLELDTVFGSVGEAVRELGYLSNTPILSSCKTGKKTKKGHTFIRL